MLKYLLYVTFFSLTFGQFGKISGFDFYIFDIFVGLLALYGTVYFLGVEKSLVIPKKSWCFITFFVIAFISLLIATPNFYDTELITAALYFLRFGTYLMSSLVVFNMIEKKLIKNEDFLNLVVYSGVLLAVAGFIQLLVLPDFTILDPSLGWDPHKNRLASTFFDPNFVGAYFVVCLVVVLESLSLRPVPSGTELRSREERKKAVLFLLILLALFLTYSRSAWGMFGIVILTYGILKYRFLVPVALLVAFLAYFAIPRIQTRVSGITDPNDSAGLRLVSWGNTLNIIKDHFWTGVGFNTFRFVQRDYGYLNEDTFEVHSGAGSDSSLLFALATTGIFGLLVYFSGFVCSLRRKEPNLLVLSLILGFLVESQFVNSLFYPQIMFVLFVLLF